MGIGGPGASFAQYILKPKNVQVDGSSLQETRMFIAGNDKSRMGRDLLNYGILTLDYRKCKYAFEKYKQPYNHDRYDYGFSLAIDRKRAFAGCVWDNTEAGKKGMRSGDKLLAINGLDLLTLDECDMEPKLMAELRANKPSVEITFQHGEEPTKTVVLGRAAY